MKIRFLGTGTSYGVPRIGCGCAVCTSDDPRNQRRRSSVLIEDAGRRLLVDTTPDLRAQLLDARVASLDLVVITHFHADHIFGLDDLRAITDSRDTALPIAIHPEIDSLMHGAFGYVFRRQGKVGGIPFCALHPFEDFVAFEAGGFTVLPLPCPHGRFVSRGLRVGPVGYVTDCNDVPAPVIERLRGVDVFILDMLRRTPHPTHLHLARSLEIAAAVGARETWFLHMGHDIDHAVVDAELPAGVRLAYDGLEITASA